jgi:RHS repeat-associated protein
MTTAAICAPREVSWQLSFYRGEQYDSDLGLYYLRARYYDPVTGRFLSRDPENGWPTTPATLHKYLYADGDPVNGFDPAGREDAAVYPLFLTRVSISAAVISGLKATAAAITCALIWEGTKTYAYTVAGPYGKIVPVLPCVWMGIPAKKDDPKWNFKEWLDNQLKTSPPEPTRCEKVRAECQAYCWESVQFRKGNRQGALRRCTRLCMQGQGCNDY